MRTFKRIDLFLNIGLLLFVTAACLLKELSVFNACLVTGSWQVVSMLVHVKNGWFQQGRSNRKFYHYAIAGLLVLGIISPWLPAFDILSVILIIILALIALTYTMLCYRECLKMKDRPLSMVK